MIETNYEALESLSMSDLISLREYMNYKLMVETDKVKEKDIKWQLVNIVTELETKINNLFIT